MRPTTGQDLIASVAITDGYLEAGQVFLSSVNTVAGSRGSADAPRAHGKGRHRECRRHVCRKRVRHHPRAGPDARHRPVRPRCRHVRYRRRGGQTDQTRPPFRHRARPRHDGRRGLGGGGERAGVGGLDGLERRRCPRWISRQRHRDAAGAVGVRAAGLAWTERRTWTSASRGHRAIAGDVGHNHARPTPRLRWPSPRLVISDLSGPIALSGGRIDLRGLSGSANGGSLTIDGGFVLKGSSWWTARSMSRRRGWRSSIQRGLRSEMDALSPTTWAARRRS